MIDFLTVVLFLNFKPERLVRLWLIHFRLISTDNAPPVCFMTVFESASRSFFVDNIH